MRRTLRGLGVNARELDDDALLDEAEAQLHRHQELLRQARAERQRERLLQDLDVGTEAEVLEPATVLRARLTALRKASGRKQQELADDMKRLGFASWERITVTETELGKRRPTWEELIGFAILFDVPLAALVGYPPGDAYIKLNESLAVSALSYMLLVGNTVEGDDGAVRSITLPLGAGARAIGLDPDSGQDWRPAVQVFGGLDS